ncbi:hypothetical protein MAQ5080_00559 [Marinomonas aquimarina]|uniref:SPOR domain-containing protein n=1 Tax=Marinomonas aquimarina TaxID=295068 RepID=A0A1A8T693_9GAMM|nr:hypothetical protein [Marinomonas aquimarina]SBS26581.1 hypothetical protein MAQ5080_00559 [Marinomonas aquimarina]
MRLLLISALILSANSTYANDILDRLKARYKAIEQGEVALPELNAPQQNISTTPSNNASMVNLNSSDVFIPSGEELIVTLYFDRYLLGDIFGVKTDSGAAFSLADIATVLDFPITTQNEAPQAQGWVRTPDNTFSLSILENQSSITLAGVTYPVSQEAIVDIDELFIDADTLEDWFDIIIDINYQELKANISSNAPLPLQERIARQSRSGSIQPNANVAQNPLAENDYSPLSLPLLDIQASTSFAQNRNQSTNLSVLGGNDLAYFNTQYYLAANSEIGLTGARLQASKTSPEAGLLGPLQATILELGDIRPTRVNNTLNSSNAVGLRVSNEKIGNINNTSIDLFGDIQPGWDIEIYRNNLLIASDTNIEDGRYNFDNLPLVFGANTVEIVFYGPQGQIEREVESYYVDGTGLGAGSFVYDVSLYEDGAELFDSFLDAQSNSQSYGTTLTGRGTFGLTDWLSINVGQQTHLDSEYRAFDRQSVGFTTSLFGQALLSSDYIVAPDSSSIEEHTLSTEVLGQSLDYSITKSKYQDELTQDWQTSKNDEINLSGEISALNLSYQQDIERQQSNNQTEYQYRNQIATSIQDIYLSHELEWGSLDDDKVGRWQLQKFIDGYFVRVGSSYVINPDFHVNGISTEVSGAPFENIQAQVSYSRNLDTQVNNIALSTSWRPGDFSLRSRLAYNDLLGWSANLSGQVSIGQIQQGYFTSNRSLVSQGSLSVFVYQDNNNNGVFDLQDQALPDIDVLSKQSFRRAKTDKNGIAVIESLPNYRQTDIEVDEGSVANPYLIPRGEGVSVIPRSSVVQHIEIPMVNSIEIEGKVSELLSNEAPRPVAFVPVQLLDKFNQVIDEVNTEFDGYYVFSRVPPGQHSIRVKPEYLVQRSYLPQTATQIDQRRAQDNLILGENLYIRKGDEVSGYSSEIRSFASLGALRSYWTILRKRQPQLLDYHYFYQQNGQTYTLYIGFSEERQPAENACEKFTTIGLACSVQAITRR